MEYKHFSHPHYLTFQQLQPGPEIRCSGCKTPATSPIYTCWQCNFFLHEQCYKASRALNHNSHPSHPLTLIPYPTYPSGSFICNSCNQTGTGFSFSCSNCDFDLHVHCAYNSQTTPNESSSYPFGPTQNFSLPNSQFPFPPPPTSTHESYPNFPTPNFNSQYHYIPQSTNFNNQSHAQHPNETVHSFNDQMGPNFQHPLPNQTPPSFSYPMGPPQPLQNMQNLQYPPPYVAPVPSFNAQTRPEVTEVPSNTNNKPINVSTSGENQQNLQGVKHFSHPHALLFSQIKKEDGTICSGCEQKISGGSAYTCMVSNCNFNLHNSCFGLPRELKHKSHPKHSLSLLSIPPYKEDHQFTCNACLENGGAFLYNCSICNFDLHVNCAFLPERVAREDHEHSLPLLYSLPLSAKKVLEDDPSLILNCDVCRGTVDQRSWFYSCQDCNFGTHLGCVTAEKRPQGEEQPSELAMMLETQLQLQRLQIEMQMCQQLGQIMVNGGQSVNNLAPSNAEYTYEYFYTTKYP